MQYKPNFRVSEPTILPVCTTFRRKSVFNQQCQQPHSNYPYLLQVSLRHTDSCQTVNTQQSYGVSLFYFFFFLFALWPAVKAHVHIDDILASPNFVPNLSYSVLWLAKFFLPFLPRNMGKKKSVPRRYSSPSATALAAALAPAPARIPRLPRNRPHSQPSHLRMAYGGRRPSVWTVGEWVPLHRVWVLSQPLATAAPSLWIR